LKSTYHDYKIKQRNKGLQRQVILKDSKDRKRIKENFEFTRANATARLSNRDLKLTNHRLGNEIWEKEKTIEYLQVDFDKGR
jgi:hypothetical protein